MVGELLFFTGPSDTVQGGDKVVHGKQGEVVGPATDEAVKGKGVAIKFPGNQGNVSCFLKQVSREPPLASSSKQGEHLALGSADEKSQ